MKRIAAMIFFFVALAMMPWQGAQAATIEYSGTDGDLEWSIDSDGHLKISGEGDYEPCYYHGYGPAWTDYAEYIKTAEVDVTGITSTAYMFDECTRLTRINVNRFDTSQVMDMSYMFCECSNLVDVDVSEFNTSLVRNMSHMFYQCKQLINLDIGGFNTSQVTMMDCMFSDCINLTKLDVSQFDTSHVVNMSGMFSHCKNLSSLNVSKFNTSQVTDMNCMFYFSHGSKITSLDVSGFNTSKVTNMYCMFSGCSGLTSLDVSGFDTSQVTDMYAMFEGCESLISLDVSGFNTSKVTNMYCMFSGCSGLTSLDVSGFDTSQVTDMDWMFSDCFGLTSIKVGAWTLEYGTIIYLPTVSGYHWIDSDGNTVTQISESLESAMTYTRVNDGYEIYGLPTSFICPRIPSLITYQNKINYYYIWNSPFYQILNADKALNGTSFPIPGLATTNTIVDSGDTTQYVNNDTYVPQGICRMEDYILISAYQESYKGVDAKKKQIWKADYNSVIYVLDGSSFEYVTTLVLPNKYHNGGIAFDGDNVWLTNTKDGAKEVYYIKKDVIESKIAETSFSGPYSAMIRESELGTSFQIKNVPSCLTYHDGKLWVGTNGGNGQICGYMVTERSTDNPVLTTYKCDTITTASISGMSASAAKYINGIEFDGSDLYISVSSGRQGASKHIIRAKKVDTANIGSSYKVAKKVLVPDMGEEMLIEDNTLYCVFESGANHYNGSYGRGPSIVTERVLAFDKSLWED
nr:BspA family leucine-rich repeat surface protein [Eubacterium sp.]